MCCFFFFNSRVNAVCDKAGLLSRAVTDFDFICNKRQLKVILKNKVSLLSNSVHKMGDGMSLYH